MPTGSSLKDIGFDEVGMDEGWAACPPSKKMTKNGKSHGRDPAIDPRAAAKRQQVDKAFSIGNNQTSMMHRMNSDGTISPVVDQLLFPDMASLVKKIHAKGLKAGWYLNDCLSYCESLGDTCSAEECIPGDVKAFIAYGFDSLKVCCHMHR